MRVFLHVAAMNHYREVVAELSGAISASGLYDVATALTCSIVGGGSVDGLLGEKWSNHHTGTLEEYEYPTLDLLHTQARLTPSDSFLYLHTKGVSKPAQRKHRDAWRRYMTHCVIERWKECVQLLEDSFNTVGNDWQNDKYSPGNIYAGNFWWARGDYIASLTSPTDCLTKSPKGPRYGAELWVGTGDVHPCMIATINSRYLHRPFPIPESAYRSSS